MYDEGSHYNDTNEAMDSTPLAAVQHLVLAQADELKRSLDSLEETISYRSKELDELTRARDVVHAALMGTEKVRVSILEDQPQPEEEKHLRAPTTTRKRAPRKA